MSDDVTLRDKISADGIRKEIFALFCLTVIAIICILKLEDPENIVINIIVAIGAFAGGAAMGQKRMGDQRNPSGDFTQTLTETTTASKKD